MQVVDVRWYAAHCVALMNQLVCILQLVCQHTTCLQSRKPAVAGIRAFCLLVIWTYTPALILYQSLSCKVLTQLKLHAG